MATSQPVPIGKGQPESDSDLHDVAHLVHEEFDDQLDPRQVGEIFSQVAERFSQASVRSFVPLLVRRYVREELQGRLRQASL
jgi:hypothetical protein